MGKRRALDSDTSVVAALSRGDANAYAVLFDRHGRAVFRYSWGVAQQRADVDDIVQETFIVAWKRRSAIRLVGNSALPWLLATCRHVASNINRQRFRQMSEELREPANGDPAWYRRRDYEDAVAQLAWVRSELDALSDVDRHLATLCLLEGRRYDEAAESLGLTVGAARKRIQRTRDRLRAIRATNV
jgi:RNA polymerase sigma-70 factor (ECF subfamily)